MKSSKILFRINDRYQKEVNIGDLFLFLDICYWRGKDLGYDDIYFEWPIRLRFFTDTHKYILVPCPPDKFLPINTITRQMIQLEDYDRVINLNRQNSLYNRCPPIYDNRRYPLGNRNYMPIISYLNMHYAKTGRHPQFDIPKDKVDNPYILFHFRNVNYEDCAHGGVNDRNVSPKVISHMFKLMKNRYGDRYQMWKCGEPIRMLDRKFDYVAPYFADNINNLLRLINNSSLFIVADSSPTSAADILNVPRIRYECAQLTRKGEVGWHTPEYWKLHGGIGKTMNEWQDINKYIMLWKEDGLDGIDDERIFEFADKWL